VPFLLVCSLVAGFAAPAAAEPIQSDPAFRAQLVEALNGARAGKGLRGLRVSPSLARAARAHATDMGVLGYFSHSSADGRSSSGRIRSFYNVSGASSWKVGEIMLWATGRLSAQDAVATWLASPPHHRELMNRRYRELGVGAVYVPKAPGVYGGRSVTIVVIDFGRRG
jgi:uncharacterized protein YkwD